MSNAHLYTSRAARAHYLDGVKAGREGQPFNDPHPVGAFAGRAWRDGWTDGRVTFRIRELNDRFRTTMGTAVGIPGRVMLTQGVAGEDWTARAVTAVARTEDFGDDPYGEHDFGALDVPGCPERIFWKIDYYNRTMDAGSEAPAVPEITTRILTIMLSSEY